jgi:1-acyl-sn-glycerol-3-phosphate acyltransferase
MADVIEIGPSVPRWRNRPLYWLGRSILRLGGWRLNLHFPDEPKLMVIAAPHTSNWDFVFGIAAILVMQVELHWYAKHTLFVGVWDRFFRGLGGFPVDRNAPGGLIEQTARRYAESKTFMVAVTPEGTRSRRSEWKRGFYYIAQRAQVPVLIGYIDYGRKEVGTTHAFRPTGDWDTDMRPVFDFYRGIKAKRPENFAVED